jgi:hypothetical protein
MFMEDDKKRGSTIGKIYAPVVDWPTIRVFAIFLLRDWHTRQVDVLRPRQY